jgi:exodeoxyribonuclease V alpha subunit
MTKTHDQFHGLIEKIIYKDGESGFTVLSLKVGATQAIIATGIVPHLHEGESINVTGTWGFHPKFGRQLTITNASSELPTNIIGIKKYLGSGLIKGIGPKFAERLVEAFGEQTLAIIDTQPGRLTEVSGVGPKRVEAIMKAWHDQKAISEVMIFLQAKGVSTSFATKIYKRYGKESIATIQENPYRLIDDIWGVGFKTADQLALKLGLSPHAYERIAATIIYAISQAIQDGHLYLDLPTVIQQTTELLSLGDEMPEATIKQTMRDLHKKEKIILVSPAENEHYLSLPQYYFSEKGIAHKIKKMHSSKSTFEFDIQRVYTAIRQPDGRGTELNDDQQHGILECLQQRISIITGGPGTGKTTLIRRLLEELKKQKLKIRLAAPTGRAAKRMFESTGNTTETLHRLLEFTPLIMNFARNEQNALDLDFLIVDESSMIDVFLMHALLKALPGHAHLLLLGDSDQLPSVGAGNILHDLIDSGLVPVTRLTHIFRQAQNSLIIVNAHKVNKGEFPTSFQEGAMRDFIFIKESIPENTFELLKEVYTQKLPRLGIPLEETITLVPMNKGIVGTARINQELQMLLNSPRADSKEIMRFGKVYRTGDRVMQLRNNYDKFVFNGDLGSIHDIDHENHIIKVQFGEKILDYDFAELDELTHSYAISIHKSQGSEFQAVIIPLFMQHFMLLQRNLLYTAITRAKKICLLIGDPKAIALCIKNNKGVKRTTFLKEFLVGDLTAR